MFGVPKVGQLQWANHLSVSHISVGETHIFGSSVQLLVIVASHNHHSYNFVVKMAGWYDECNVVCVK